MLYDSLLKKPILQPHQEYKYMDKYCHYSTTKPMADISSCYRDALRRKKSTTVRMWQEWLQRSKDFKLYLEEKKRLFQTDIEEWSRGLF